MWKRFVSWLRSTRLGSWFATDTLKAMAAVCFAFVVLAFAVGALVPHPFVQNVAADLIGGLLAGLVIFGLANIAFGFTERREKERRALKLAYGMLVLEMFDNRAETARLVSAVKRGSLTYEDPLFWEDERLKAEKWQLLAQSPLVEHLSPDLWWTICVSYDLPPRLVNQLRKNGRALGGHNPEAWIDLCKKHLNDAEAALLSVESAWLELGIAHDKIKDT